MRKLYCDRCKSVIPPRPALATTVVAIPVGVHRRLKRHCKSTKQKVGQTVTQLIESALAKAS